MIAVMGAHAPPDDDDLRAIAHPVRLSVGDRDATGSIDECEAALRLLPLGELEVHPATPHPFERAPVERLARSIGDFVV